MKKCSKCGLPREINKKCAPCRREYQRSKYQQYSDSRKLASKKFREKNPTYQKDYDLKLNYNISLAEYNKIKSQQDDQCKICGILEKDSGSKGLVVDHDHTNGNIRGLLCSNCNRALGYFKDNPQIVLNAAKYLLQNRVLSDGTWRVFDP